MSNGQGQGQGQGPPSTPPGPARRAARAALLRALQVRRGLALVAAAALFVPDGILDSFVPRGPYGGLESV